MANILTSFRIICSLILFFCPAFSSSFYFFYLIAGFTDMIDGTVARKTNTASEFGAKLDTVADFVFVVICFIKILPVLNIPVWIWIWTGVIAGIKICNAILSRVVQKKLLAEHTILNKVTGFLLFMLPFSLFFVELKISGAIVCTFASIAAIQEGWISANLRGQDILRDDK